jgi:hypothetical protein
LTPLPDCCIVAAGTGDTLVNAKLALWILGAAAMLALPLFAHHSFSAQFDAAKPVILEGVVTKVDWFNPHVYFYVDVKDAKGATANWACETGAPNGLIRQGWKRDSLKVGDRVTVSAYLAKDGSKTVDARVVTLADGRRIFAGSPNDGGPKADSVK